MGRGRVGWRSRSCREPGSSLGLGLRRASRCAPMSGRNMGCSTHFVCDGGQSMPADASSGTTRASTECNGTQRNAAGATDLRGIDPARTRDWLPQRESLPAASKPAQFQALVHRADPQETRRSGGAASGDLNADGTLCHTGRSTPAHLEPRRRQSIDSSRSRSPTGDGASPICCFGIALDSV